MAQRRWVSPPWSPHAFPLSRNDAFAFPLQLLSKVFLAGAEQLCSTVGRGEMGFSPIWLHMEYFYLRDDYQLFVDIAKSNDAVVGELQAKYEKNPPEMVSEELRWPSNPSSAAFEHDGLHDFCQLMTCSVISETSLCLCRSGCRGEAPLDLRGGWGSLCHVSVVGSLGGHVRLGMSTSL